MRLTDLTIRSLKAPEQGVKVFSDGTLAGFGVRCSQGGSRSFVLTLPDESRRRVTLGKVGIVSLADARALAKQMLAEATLGKHRPARKTFAAALEEFIETRKAKNRAKTAYETERILRLYFRPVHAKHLADLRAHHVTEITDALARKGLRSTAAHAHAAAHTFLRFCAQRQYVLFNPIADLEKPAAPKARERVLGDEELKAVWQAADEAGHPFGNIVKLLILTGQRRGEVALLRRDWITIEEGTVSLPKEYTKNKRGHVFPIAALSSQQLSALMPGSTSVRQPLFSSPTDCTKPFTGWSKAKILLDAKAKIAPWTLHDLRRTYATNLQRIGIKTEVIEALLNHVSGTRAGIVGVYQKHRWWDEMVDAVGRYEAWLQAEIVSQASIDAP
ncbi:MAG: tyrosine-type recombinase/integrase [Acetobacteraceae bacterium]